MGREVAVWGGIFNRVALALPTVWLLGAKDGKLSEEVRIWVVEE